VGFPRIDVEAVFTDESLARLVKVFHTIRELVGVVDRIKVFGKVSETGGSFNPADVEFKIEEVPSERMPEIFRAIEVYDYDRRSLHGFYIYRLTYEHRNLRIWVCL